MIHGGSVPVRTRLMRSDIALDQPSLSSAHPAPEGVDSSWRDHALTSVRTMLGAPCDALHSVNVPELALDLDAMLLGTDNASARRILAVKPGGPWLVVVDGAWTVESYM